MASSGDLTQPLPKLVAVDLDYTLWPCWVDTHISPPLLEGSNPNELIDRAGRKFGFYADVPEILMSLRSSGVKLAACSRTHRPDMYVNHTLVSSRLNRPLHGEGSVHSRALYTNILCFYFPKRSAGSLRSTDHIWEGFEFFRRMYTCNRSV